MPLPTQNHADEPPTSRRRSWQRKPHSRACDEKPRGHSRAIHNPQFSVPNALLGISVCARYTRTCAQSCILLSVTATRSLCNHRTSGRSTILWARATCGNLARALDTTCARAKGRRKKREKRFYFFSSLCTSRRLLSLRIPCTTR